MEARAAEQALRAGRERNQDDLVSMENLASPLLASLGLPEAAQAL